MQVIRFLMAEGKTTILDHAQDRFDERDLDMGDVINVVKTGAIKGVYAQATTLRSGSVRLYAGLVIRKIGARLEL